MLLNNKIVDYINFILRAGDIPGCSTESVLELKSIIGTLIVTLIEENSPESLQIAKEIKDTIDKDALYRLMGNCYRLSSVWKSYYDYLLYYKIFYICT